MADGRGTLEVIVLTVTDAEQAERGGADRLEVVGTMDDDGLSPDPSLLARMAEATALPLRVMVRLRAGFGAERADLPRLRELALAYREVGAEGLVLGFLDASGGVDVAAVTEIATATDLPWTFHRAIDAAASPEEAWSAVERMPRLDQVLTAGSAAGVEAGLTALTRRAEDPDRAGLVLAGGGLRLGHLRPLAGAGVRGFHIGSAARAGGDFASPVQAGLVRQWREAVDAAVELPAPVTDQR